MAVALQDNASTEGDRVLVGVMVKDSDKFPSTGGWCFEGFAGDSRTERLVNDGGQSCFAGHASQKDSAYVYTHWRDG
ncbi:MAG: cytochrome P460 family protein [Gammaproteobacteria bacterium]